MPKVIPASEQRGSQRGPGKIVPVKGAKKKDKGHGGPLGLVENLAKDVGEAIVGLPAGVKEIAVDPALKLAHGDVKGAAKEALQPVKAIGKSYAQTYGPLTHGDVSRFLHNLYEHPLGPTLDLLSVLTLGGAAAGAVGARTAATLGEVGSAGRIARLGARGEIKLRSPTQLAKEGKLGKDLEEFAHLQGNLDVRIPTSRNPVIHARKAAVDRMLKRLPADTRYIGEIARWARESERLPRRQALALRHAAQPYNKAVHKLSNEEQVALHLISGGVSPGDWKRYLLSGGDVSETTLKVLDNPKVAELWHNPSEKMRVAHAEGVKLSDLDRGLKVKHGRLTEETAAERLGFHRKLAEDKLGPIEAAPLDPFYIPDRAVHERVPNIGFGRQGGGLGNPQEIVHQNRGILFKTGQLAMDPRLLGSEFLRTVKYALFDDIHNTLLSGAVRVPGERLPEGWVYIRRRTRRGRVVERGKGTPERIGYVERTKAEHVRGLQDLIDDPENIPESKFAEEGFTTPHAHEADTHMGYRLAVPKSLADQLAGEFARSSAGVRLLLERPTTIWRALTLGYRPGFLTNNVVGNHLLLALRFAGVDGLRAYLHALGRTKARKLLLRKDIPHDEAWQQLKMEWFPETIGGTFGEVQAVRGGVSARTKRNLERAKAGIIPATQAASETFLRDVALETALRKNPAVKAMARKMKGQTKDFTEVSRRALEEDPLLQREVSQQIDDALGDYTSQTTFERRVLRQIMPFWAWYRAIATIAAKMALDTPGRAAIISRLGQIEAEALKDQLGDVPDFLRGTVPVAGGLAGVLLGGTHPDTQPVLTTAGINPLGTVRELGQAAGALATGKPGEAAQQALPLTNPFLQALIEQATGQSTFGGKATPTRLPGILAVPERIFTNVPQAQLTRGPSAMYPHRDLRSQLLAFLGVPVKELNLAETRRRAREEQRR